MGPKGIDASPLPPGYLLPVAHALTSVWQLLPPQASSRTFSPSVDGEGLDLVVSRKCNHWGEQDPSLAPPSLSVLWSPRTSCLLVLALGFPTRAAAW